MQWSRWQAAGLLLVGLGMMVSPVQADEVWNSNVGQIIYAEDIGPTTVFTYGTEQDPGVIYIVGLAKVYEGRGTYDGYWAKNHAKVACKTLRPGINGAMTPFWGRFQIRFLDANFPSRWEGAWTYCDDLKPQPVKIMATPLVAEENPPPANPPETMPKP